MKKTYIAPRILLMEVDTSVLLAGSDPINRINSVGNGVQLGNELDWDDDWDEE